MSKFEPRQVNCLRGALLSSRARKMVIPKHFRTRGVWELFIFLKATKLCKVTSIGRIVFRDEEDTSELQRASLEIFQMIPNLRRTDHVTKLAVINHTAAEACAPLQEFLSSGPQSASCRQDK
jgi:hypothetical protein